jgi:hypothetical protein
MDLSLAFQSDRVHSTQDIDRVVSLYVDQAEVVDHGGHVGERVVTVRGNFIDLTSINSLSFAIETTEEIDLSIHVTSLAVPPVRSHWRQGCPGAFHCVELGCCVQVNGFLATLLHVPTKNVDTLVNPDSLGCNPLILICIEELPGALGDVERPHLGVVVATNEVQVEAYHNSNAENMK